MAGYGAEGRPLIIKEYLKKKPAPFKNRRGLYLISFALS